MNITSTLALCLPALATYVLLRRVSAALATPLDRGTVAVVAPGLGVGLASCLYFVLLMMAGNHRTAVRLDAALWTAVWAALVVRVGLKKRLATQDHSPAPQPTRVAMWRDPRFLVPAAGCVVLATVATLSFWQHWAATPHGEWDAWAIWNLRARGILRGAPEWGAVFSPALAWSHVDYPLLLPIAVARVWAYGGHESPVVPAVIAMLFFASSFLTILALVGRSRGWPAGLLAGMALLVPRTFVFQGSCQCGDIPIGFFLLVAVAFVVMSSEAANPGPLLLVAGAAAGLAAWTKNEGVLLLILVGLAACARTLRLRSVLYVAAGAAVPLVAIALFHLLVAPPSNYLFDTPGSGSIAEKLVDPARWTVVAGRLVHLLPAWGAVRGGALTVLGISVVLTVGTDRQSLGRAAWGLLLIAAMFGGYSLVYVITPLPVDWQIATSFDRVVTQLWPALVWTAFQLTGGSVAVRPREAGAVLLRSAR